MAHIDWTNDLNTGIAVIDKQHHRIVEYINQLYDVRKTHTPQDLEKILQELVDYTLSHFAFEESLMEEANYRFITGHKRVHDMFRRRISDFMQRLKLGEDITEELLSVLKSWLLNHIRSDDNDYVDVVKADMEKIHQEQGEGWVLHSLKKFFA